MAFSNKEQINQLTRRIDRAHDDLLVLYDDDEPYKHLEVLHSLASRLAIVTAHVLQGKSYND